MGQLWFYLTIGFLWLLVGFVVCSYVLAKPEPFSWRRWLNPFEWWSQEDAFVGAAYLLAPVWPIVLLVAGIAKLIAGTVEALASSDAPRKSRKPPTNDHQSEKSQ